MLQTGAWDHICALKSSCGTTSHARSLLLAGRGEEQHLLALDPPLPYGWHNPIRRGRDSVELSGCRCQGTPRGCRKEGWTPPLGCGKWGASLLLAAGRLGSQGPASGGLGSQAGEPVLRFSTATSLEPLRCPRCTRQDGPQTVGGVVSLGYFLCWEELGRGWAQSNPSLPAAVARPGDRRCLARDPRRGHVGLAVCPSHRSAERKVTPPFYCIISASAIAGPGKSSK